MQTRTRARHLPMRLTTGGYILNAGVDMIEADHETTKGIHAMAAEAFPVLGEVDPQTFTRILATSEIVLGGALMTPLIPSRYAGAGLGAFAAGLLAMYARIPRMHRSQSIRPTREGLALAKDAWMLGIALALVGDRGSGKRRGRRKD